jgi:hypothetical protein
MAVLAPLYMVGLAICTWLCLQFSTWLGWHHVPAGLAIYTWLCYNPLPGWTGYLYMVVLQTLQPSTWLGWLSSQECVRNPLPGWPGYLAHGSTTAFYLAGLVSAVTPLSGCAPNLYLARLLAFCSWLCYNFLTG